MLLKYIITLLSITLLPIILIANSNDTAHKIDDWDYNTTQNSPFHYARGIKGTPAILKSMAIPAPVMAMKKMGLTVGGAQDANNFYDNIYNNYLPKLSSITYEGVFSDHYFQNPKAPECRNLFCPAYATAVTKDFFDDSTTHYLQVGLESNINPADFKRPKLNLVVVLDISGSMASPFDRYYYDQEHCKHQGEGEQKSKITIAAQAIAALTRHLKPEDNFGVILFDDRAYRAKPLRLVAHTDMDAIRKHILALQARGGTNWSAGYQEALDLFKQTSTSDPDTQNRIIFLTDAMPNRGELREKGLFGLSKQVADRGIYTTFIGIGVDFNTDLVEKVSKIRGANYYAVHSQKSFKKRMDEEFDYMVTPVIFDLKLTLQSDAYEIVAVYGSPQADQSTQTLLSVKTLFPTPTDEKGAKGGVILVKLKQRYTTDKPIKLQIDYDDTKGKHHTNQTAATFKQGYYYQSPSIQKAILLAQYTTLMQNYLLDMRRNCNDHIAPIPYPFLRKRCALVPQDRPIFRSIETWERRSCPLEVSPGYHKLISIFLKHFESVKAQVADPSLEKEQKLLQHLLKKSLVHLQKGKQRVDDWGVSR